MGLRLTDVVKNLLIINVIVYFATYFFLGDPPEGQLFRLVNLQDTDFTLFQRYMGAVFYPGSQYFEPYQLVTYMFMHGDPMHLFFNMFTLAMLGPAIEQTWGPKKFLFYYFFTGLGALALNFAVTYIEINYMSANPLSANVPLLGASGSVFGVLAAFGMLFPNQKLMLIFPPIPIKAKYFVLGLAAIELFSGIGGFQTGIAHFAHLGGALFGFLLILYWRNTGERLY